MIEDELCDVNNNNTYADAQNEAELSNSDNVKTQEDYQLDDIALHNKICKWNT
jgi:hypothetical protein